MTAAVQGTRAIRLAVLGALLAAGVAVRYVDLDRQFTHVDDVGVAESILVQGDLYDLAYVRSKIHDPKHEAHGSVPYRLLRRLDANGQLESALPLLVRALRPVVIPLVYTYAPFQFPLTSALISRDQSYRSVLYWGRIPSFLASVAALVLIVAVHRRMDPRGWFLAAACSLALLTFSWEHIIYAKHMSSYSIGALAALLLLLALIDVAMRDGRYSTTYLVLMGLALAAVSHMQYQILFFMPAFYLVWAAAAIPRARERGTVLRGLLLTGAVYGLAIAPMVSLFLLHRTGRGTGWVGFLAYPILLDVSQDASVFDKGAHAARFVATNFYEVFEFLFAHTPSTSSIAVNVVFLGLLAFGLWRLVTSRDSTCSVVGWFFVVSAASTLALVLGGRLTLGPTRHALVFLPFMIVCISYGVQGVAAVVSPHASSRRSDRLAIAATAVVVLFASARFAYGVSDTLDQRRDLFVEDEIARLVAEYNPDVVIARASAQMTLMAPTKFWPRTHSPGMREFALYRNPARGPGEPARVVMFAGLHPLKPDDYNRIADQFGLELGAVTAGAAATLFSRSENTGACVDVCVSCGDTCLDRRGGDNGLFLLIVATDRRGAAAQDPAR